MIATAEFIPLTNLAFAFVPVAIVIAIMYQWSLGGGTAIYGMARMLLQLLAIGYVLTYIFKSEHAWIICGVLALMLAAASWIALRPLKKRHPTIYGKVLASIAIGGVTTLALVTQIVLQLDPWFAPRFMVPLAGMIFSNGMNTVSLAAERLNAEMASGADYDDARGTALKTALLPLINSLFAVGLVSFPGMMTGQILAGESPLVAARYQIVVMCMIFGSAGISVACFLVLFKSEVVTKQAQSHA